MPTPHHYTSCMFLPEIDKSSDSFRVVTFGVPVEHFGISLQTEGLAKIYELEKRYFYLRKC